MTDGSGDELLATLEDTETVLAAGACHDVTEGVDGHLHARVLVTTRALRWQIAETRWLVAVPFGIVTSMSERPDAHRCTIALDHAAIDRTVHLPARRFLMFAWGNAEATRPFTSTALLFSRRDTEAARAIRTQLASRTELP